MTTMNQFIPPQRKLDQSVSKVDGPAKMGGHSQQTSLETPNFGYTTVHFFTFQSDSKSGSSPKWSCSELNQMVESGRSCITLDLKYTVHER